MQETQPLSTQTRPLSMRLVNALTLRDGTLQHRSVAIDGGRITKGPLPEVDLSGYYILPGIVDLYSTALDRRGALPFESALHSAARHSATHGITTQRIAQGWSWRTGPGAPETARSMLHCLSRLRESLPIDLRATLQCETHTVATQEALLAAVRRHNVDLVLFTNQLAQHRLTDDAAGPEMARAAAEKPLVPRHLCRLAESFDTLGTLYGSLDDADGETRETYSMIGAKLCMRPATRAAAALARAVGDPVALAAADILARPQRADGLATDVLIRQGLCDALISAESGASLVEAVFDLVDRSEMTLARAWALVSRGPAEILRQPDRGVIDYGKRADLVVINAATRQVEATISAGRIAHLCGAAAERFLRLRADSPMMIAAE